MQTEAAIPSAWNPQIVGSFGSSADLRDAIPGSVAAACDVVEIRLDLLLASGAEPESPLWRHLAGMPLLFTARRPEEGGALPLDASRRNGLLRSVLEDAAYIDLEVAGIDESTDLLEEIQSRGIPWIASFHDFGALPPDEVLAEAAARARQAGASIFKAAAALHSPADLARLAAFQLAGHGLPVATMGMGPLAPVSRLLCAQCGSVLNYGYLGETPTAPGQWDGALLKQAVQRLVPFRT